MAFCHQCSIPLLTGQDAFFDLLPCRHTICPNCFGLQHGKRGCNPSFICPDRHCHASVVGHRCTQKYTVIRGRVQQTRIAAGDCVMYAGPNKDTDPVRLYLSKDQEYRSNHVTLSLAMPKLPVASGVTQNTPTQTITAFVPVDKPKQQYSPELCEALEYFMTLLHHVFFDREEVESEEIEARSTNMMSPGEIFDLALANNSLFLRAIIAFGTGRTRQNLLPSRMEKDNIPQRNSYLAYWAAAQLIFRGSSRRTTILQEFLGHQLAIWKANGNLVDLLSALRISSSYRNTRLKDIKTVNDKILKGIDVEERKWGMSLIAYDNLGFKKRGKDCGYIQYTLMQLHYLSEKRLLELGFYLPPGSSRQSISRQRAEWSDICHRYDASSVLPTGQDYERLGEHVYSHIDAILQIINSIPTVDEAEDILERHGRYFDIETKLVTRYADRKRQQQEVEGYEEEEDQDSPTEDEEETPIYDPCLNEREATTMYNSGYQQVEMDLPLKADLNKKSTVKSILEGAMDIRRRALAGPSTRNTDEAPLMEDLGIFTGGDNSPHFTYLGLKEADSDHYKKVTDHCGGFHLYLNGKKKHGSKFGDTHVRYHISPIRDTDKKQEWYLNPGDPGQTAREEPERTDAHYVTAARSLAKQQQARGDPTPISAVDVDDFMLLRARQHNHCLIVLMDLRMVEISNMLRDSESRDGKGDVELFLSATKLSLLLFAKTNAVKYIRTAVEYWIWWQIASDADKVIYKEFLFVKKSGVNEDPIWLDRFHEWMNEDVRSYLGKYAQPNIDALLTKVTMLLRERRSVKKEYATTFSQGTNDRGRNSGKLGISPIFCHQLIMLNKLNLWGEGPVCVGSYKDDTFTEATEFSNPSGKDALNTRILFDVSAAERTLKQFFRSKYLGEEDESEDGEILSFRLTPIFLKDVKDARDNDLKRRTSTSQEELESICTKGYLICRWEKLHDMHSFLEEDDGIQAPKKSDKKTEWAKGVALLHTKLLERFPSFVQDETDHMMAHAPDCGGFADQEEINQELDRPFYKLPDTVRQQFQARRFHVAVEEGTDNDDAALNDSMDVHDSPESSERGGTLQDDNTPYQPLRRRRFLSPVEDEEGTLAGANDHSRTPVEPARQRRRARQLYLSPTEDVVPPTPEEVADDLRDMTM